MSKWTRTTKRSDRIGTWSLGGWRFIPDGKRIRCDADVYTNTRPAGWFDKRSRGIDGDLQRHANYLLCCGRPGIDSGSRRSGLCRNAGRFSTQIYRWHYLGGPNGGFDGFCGGQCFYDIAIAVSPDNQTILLGGAAGTSNTQCNTSIMRRSINGGTNFATSAGTLHADEHTLALHRQIRVSSTPAAMAVYGDRSMAVLPGRRSITAILACDTVSGRRRTSIRSQFPNGRHAGQRYQLSKCGRSVVTLPGR